MKLEELLCKGDIALIGAVLRVLAPLSAPRRDSRIGVRMEGYAAPEKVKDGVSLVNDVSPASAVIAVASGFAIVEWTTVAHATLRSVLSQPGSILLARSEEWATFKGKCKPELLTPESSNPSIPLGWNMAGFGAKPLLGAGCGVLNARLMPLLNEVMRRFGDMAIASTPECVHFWNPYVRGYVPIATVSLRGLDPLFAEGVEAFVAAGVHTPLSGAPCAGDLVAAERAKRKAGAP